MNNKYVPILMFLFWLISGVSRAESQDQLYKGVQDPFGDPSMYEFAEDEKDDKEFFHLGRFLMFGLDTGVGIFTGQLGVHSDPTFCLGVKILYFFDKSVALEGAFHYANHLTTYYAQDDYAQIETVMMPITLGFRYYFDIKNSPRAIALANPYMAFGGGGYGRQQNVLKAATGVRVTPGDTGFNNSFGAFGGGGVEFKIYRKHIYFGMDLRFHYVIFYDETDENSYYVSPGDFSGDYATVAATLTYNF